MIFRSADGEVLRLKRYVYIRRGRKLDCGRWRVRLLYVASIGRSRLRLESRWREQPGCYRKPHQIWTDLDQATFGARPMSRPTTDRSGYAPTGDNLSKATHRRNLTQHSEDAQ